MVTMKTYSGDSLIEGINLTLKHRLYISGWDLSNSMVRARKRPNDTMEVALLFKDETPIAVAWYSGRNLMAFVRKSERNKGYGSKVVKHINKPTASTGYGIEGSLQFWEKNGFN